MHKNRKHIKMKSKYFSKLYQNHQFMAVEDFDLGDENLLAYLVRYKGQDQDIIVIIDDSIENDFQALGDF